MQNVKNNVKTDAFLSLFRIVKNSRIQYEKTVYFFNQV